MMAFLANPVVYSNVVYQANVVTMSFGGSATFNGSTQYVDIASTSAFGFGTGDFTIEFWWRPTVNQRSDVLDFWSAGGSGITARFDIGRITGSTLDLYTDSPVGGGGSSAKITGPTIASLLYKWNHIAVTKQSGSIRLWVNGTQAGSTYSAWPLNMGSSMALRIMGDHNASGNGSGNLTNVRVVKGTAIYTSSFTPPTSALTAVDNTQLLLLTSNSGSVTLDSSPNNLTLSAPASVGFSNLTPVSIISGSAQFSYSNIQPLRIPSSSMLTLGTNDFTIEWFQYQSVRTGPYDAVWAYDNNATTWNSKLFYINSGTTGLTVGLSNGVNNWAWIPNAGAPALNVWHHVAITRQANTFGLFLDGARVATTNVFVNIGATNSPMNIGASTGNSAPFNGYITNFRIVNGTAVYNPANTTLTVPTSPLNVTPSTGSANFTATANTYLSVPRDTSAHTLGANNFTIEFWFNQRVRRNYDGLFSYGGTGIYSTAGAINMDIGTAQYGIFIGNGSGSAMTINSPTGGLPAMNTWHHFALVRNGTQFNAYLNGANVGGASTAYSLPTIPGNIWIGTQAGSPTHFFDGQITNFRVVNGTAVYTAPFIPSKTPLTAIANTVLLLATTDASGLLTDSSANNYTVNNANGVTYSNMTPFPSTALLLKASNSGNLIVDSGVNNFTILNSPNTVPWSSFEPFNPIPYGLVSDLRNAPVSGNVWIDASGNGYNGRVFGSPTYSNTYTGGGLRLNNAAPSGTDYISVPYNFTSNTLTVEMVASFNPTGFWATLWGSDLWNSTSGYLTHMTASNSIITFGRTGTGTPVNIPPGDNIRHMVFSINGTTQSFYLNGSHLSSNVVVGQTVFPTGNLYFGARHNNSGTLGVAQDMMNSSNVGQRPVFYQMRVYNRALSATEATARYDDIKSTYGI